MKKQDKPQALPRVGVIGLGIMGGAMAEALLKAGYEVCGHDPVAAGRQRLRRAGGRVPGSNTEVAAQSDVIIVSVATSQALREVAADVAAAPRRPAGQRRILLETSTLTMADKEAARAALARAGLEVMDCPISGTAVRMKERAWTVFASGSAAAYRRVLPMLQVFTDNVPYVGP